MAQVQSTEWAYKHYGDPDNPDYRDNHIVEINFLGRTMRVHRGARNHFLHLERIFRQEAPKYSRQIDEGPLDDWSYNNRNIAGTDTKSKHAFGIAIDINSRTNYRGIRGDIPGAVVHRAEQEGFAWGGSWSYPDAMHFETTLTPQQIRRRFDDEGHSKRAAARKTAKRTAKKPTRKKTTRKKTARKKTARKRTRKTTR